MGLAPERDRWSALGLSDVVVGNKGYGNKGYGPVPEGVLFSGSQLCRGMDTACPSHHKVPHRIPVVTEVATTLCSKEVKTATLRKAFTLDKHLICVKCLQHTSSTLGDETFCTICAASQPGTLPSSPLQSIPCMQAPAHRARSRSKSPSRSSKRARHSRQAKDISELKSQMAQVLEYLVRLPPAPTPAPPPVPAPELTLPSPVVAPDVSEQDVAKSEEEQDAILITAF
ncbi:UNVERIFIED_CONTAM: hypothetical protein FKN15_026437 [Acipenser sinensis]